MVPHGERLLQMGKHWMRIHVIPRDAAYTPQLEDNGPDLSTLTDTRITLKSFLDGHTLTITDDWQSASVDSDRSPWMGTTTVLVSTSARSADSIDVPVRVADNIDEGDMMFSRPWDGNLPARSIFADSSFIRHDDGIWRKQD